MRTAAEIALTLLLWTPAACAQSRVTVSAAEAREVTVSFNALFQAMKNGDVAAIEQYSAGGMLTRYRKLFEENQEYPAFLRNFYKGASFNIVQITPAPNGQVIVDVATQLGSGSRSVTRLTAQRFDDSSAQWKVTAIGNEDRQMTTEKK